MHLKWLHLQFETLMNIKEKRQLLPALNFHSIQCLIIYLLPFYSYKLGYSLYDSVKYSRKKCPEKRANNELGTVIE